MCGYTDISCLTHIMTHTRQAAEISLQGWPNTAIGQ